MDYIFQVFIAFWKLLKLVIMYTQFSPKNESSLVSQKASSCRKEVEGLFTSCKC